ncbi:MAG: M14 family zinc carboxypeptidase [Chitinophagaceae bacterium]
MGGYYTLSQMVTKINAMKTAYSSLVRIDTIGYSWESRPILCVKISSNVNVDGGKPQILYNALHHAREPMGMMNLIFFMQYLLQNYSTNTMVQELVNNRALYFIPCFNPDGYQYNCTEDPSGYGMHRKNRRVNANTNNMGVDLNRNYGFGFNSNGGSSGTVTLDNYRGPSGFSEPETQAMRDYVNSMNFKLAINYHAYGEYWIHGFGVSAGTLTAADSKILETGGRLMTRSNFYQVGLAINTVGYNADGASDDWFMGGSGHSKLYSFSPEIGHSYATSAESFWPDADQIIPIAKEVMFANFQAAYIAGSYAKVEDRSTLSASASGDFRFTVRRIGLTAGDVVVSIVPLENIQSVGSPVTFTNLTNALDTSGGKISYVLSPSLQMGARVRFLWKMETGGISLVDTITKMYSPSSVISDDMEGTIGDKWTVSGTWSYSGTSFFQGSKALATTNSGNYANNASSAITLKTPMNLNNSVRAYLSFWVRYRTQNGYDRLRIQAASNGSSGSPTWQTLPSSFTIAENKGNIGGSPSLTGIQDYWVREFVDLSSFAGGTTVGLRFLFQSDASVTESGFFIDNLEVYKNGSSTLPVTFTSIKAIAGKDDVKVIWQAQTNDQHDHFEIERSADGMSFNVIGKVFTTGYDFSFTDIDPLPGVNYYRVKGVDKDSKYDYTAIVSARLNRIIALRIYPNPVQQQLQLTINSATASKYHFEIISPAGQVMWKSVKDVQQGVHTIELPAENLSAGMYLLKVSTNNEMILKESFIKAAN